MKKIEKAPPSARYAMYLRKSRADLALEELGEGETLARHRQMLEALADKQHIQQDQIDVYQEIVSGESIDARPEAQRLLNAVWQGVYAGVLVVEIERLARGNTRDQGEVAEAFQASSTKIITPAKTYDPNNEIDQEFFEFGLFMSRREYKAIRRRLLAGKLQAVQEGNYLPAIPPFGYKIERQSRRERLLVENPEESKWLRMIFDWYTKDRRSTTWIAKQLTLAGVPTRTGVQWDHGTIKNMLQNPHYAGYVTWGHQNTVTVKDMDTGRLKKTLVYKEKQLYKGKHKALISEEQWNEAKSIFGTAPKVKKDFELRNPLSGLLVCAKCGMTMVYRNYASQPTKCSRFAHRYRAINTCTVKSLPMEDVMQTLIFSLKCEIHDCQIKLDSGAASAAAARQRDMIEAAKKELASLQAKKRRLFDSWEADDGTYTKEEFLERKAMYTHSIEQLQDKIKELEATKIEAVDYAEKINNLHRLIDCITNEQMPCAEKNAFLKKIIQKIEYDCVDYGKRHGGKALLTVHLK